MFRQIYSKILKKFFRTAFLIECRELGEVQISLHKIVHVDWLRFCALRNKMDDERKGNAGGNGNGNSCGSEEGRQLAKRLEALDSLASEDAIQTV